MTDINQTFPAETDAATAELFEQRQRELDRYKTRYVYLPFQDAHCCPQVQGGYIPAGAIHPVPAPKGKINVRLLPDGAQILQRVSPSSGIPSAKRTEHENAEYEALLKKIEAMEEKMSARGQEPASIAIYLHEVAPIIGAVLSYHGREGGVEITALQGMPANAFEKHRINDAIFGPEGSRPTTLAGIAERMNTVIERAGSQKTEGARVLALVAKEIVAAVTGCDRFCREHIRQRHLEMDDPQNDAPKRYSQRDLRALDLAEQPRRYEYMEIQAQERKRAEAEAARREQQLIEATQRREDQFTSILAEMSQLMKVQTETLKVISKKQG